MATYPVYYKKDISFIAISGKVYDEVTKEIINYTPPPPEPVYTRTFDLPLANKVTGKKPYGYRYGDMIIRGDGYVTFYNPYCVMSGNAPRIYVYDTNREKTWKNIEVDVEYMRVSEQSSVPSYAGFGIGVRSTHELQSSSNPKPVVPTYYAKHNFDGRFFFEKEHQHGVSYTKEPNTPSNYPMERNVWYSLKFKVTDVSNSYGFVKLETWRQKVGDTIKIYRTYTDTGTWNGKTPILKGTSCFLRNDAVRDFRIRKFSIREFA